MILRCSDCGKTVGTGGKTVFFRCWECEKSRKENPDGKKEGGIK